MYFVFYQRSDLLHDVVDVDSWADLMKAQCPVLGISYGQISNKEPDQLEDEVKRFDDFYYAINFEDILAEVVFEDDTSTFSYLFKQYPEDLFKAMSKYLNIK